MVSNYLNDSLIMKKFFNSVIALTAALSMVSCMQVDNWDEPEASISGRLINAVTGENYLTDQGDVHIRIWEKSFSTNPAHQDLAVKNDGTYTNLRLFAGTYDMVPNDGSWWPCDTLRNVAIGNSNHATQDFKVTPYLMIKDFDVQLLQAPSQDMDTLRMSCRLFAPITENLPQVWEVRPFININQYCGAGNKLDYYYKDNDDVENDLYGLDNGEEVTTVYTWKKSIHKNWNQIGDMTTGEGNREYVIRVPVKRGYKYSVRMGANVNDQYRKFNYSEIKVITIPEDPTQKPNW